MSPPKRTTANNGHALASPMRRLRVYNRDSAEAPVDRWDDEVEIANRRLGPGRRELSVGIGWRAFRWRTTYGPTSALPPATGRSVRSSASSLPERWTVIARDASG